MTMTYEQLLTAFDLAARAGALDDGDRLASHCVSAFPQRAGGWAASAIVAARRGDWASCVGHWDQCFRRSSEEARPAWHLAYAEALLAVGRDEDAARVSVDAAVRHPELRRPAVELLWNLYDTSRRYRDGWQAIGPLLHETETDFFVELVRVQLLGRLGRIDEARRALDRLARLAANAREIVLAAKEVPVLCDGGERVRWLQFLLQRLAGLTHPDPVRPRMTEATIRLAMEDYAGLLTALDRVPPTASHPSHAALRRIAERLQSPGFPDYGAPKVFGIGLSKTGTTSLAKALEMLGFATIDWRSPLTNCLVTECDLFLYDAVTDTTVSGGFEPLYFMFPNSVFVYTERPLEAWRQSFRRYFAQQYGEYFELPRSSGERVPQMWYGLRWESILRTLYVNHASLEEAYLAFERRVLGFFADKPARRFLRLNIFEGDPWGPLCGFLGRPVPPQPFPWENRMRRSSGGG
jgi:hypothetical protein